MVNRMTYKITPTKVSVEFEVVGYQRLTNQALNNGSWALPTSHDRALFTGCIVKISASGAAAPTDEYAISEATVTIENNLARQHATGTNADKIIEPIRESHRRVSGTLKLARFDTDQYRTWLDGETEIQLDIGLSGQIITGAQYSRTTSHRFLIPRAKIIRADHPVPGPGIIGGEVEWEAIKPTSELTWITTALGGIEQKKDNEMLFLFVNASEVCWSRDNQEVGVTLP
jgi:hypothetical protein